MRLFAFILFHAAFYKKALLNIVDQCLLCDIAFLLSLVASVACWYGALFCETRPAHRCPLLPVLSIQDLSRELLQDFWCEEYN